MARLGSHRRSRTEAPLGSPVAAGHRRLEQNGCRHLQDRPHVIVLNGVGSVGKSSTARAFQELAARPFLHVPMDAFAAMMPARLLGHPDGMIFETVLEQGTPSVIISTGPVMARTMRGMRHAVAALAAQGNDLIVDDVMLQAAEAAEYRTLLAHACLRFVGLFAPLDVLEARERARGDRQPGLARWQFDRVHHGQSYDLEIETSRSTPAENAEQIRAAFEVCRRRLSAPREPAASHPNPDQGTTRARTKSGPALTRSASPAAAPAATPAARPAAPPAPPSAARAAAR